MMNPGVIQRLRVWFGASVMATWALLIVLMADRVFLRESLLASRRARPAEPIRSASRGGGGGRAALGAGRACQSSNMTRSRNALDGNRTPAASSRDMNVGRMPVAMNRPYARPFSSTPCFS